MTEWCERGGPSPPSPPGGEPDRPAPDACARLTGAIQEPNSLGCSCRAAGRRRGRSYAVKRSVRPGVTDRALEPVRG